MFGQIHRLGAFQHLLIGHTCATRPPLLFSLYTSIGGRDDPVWGVYKGAVACGRLGRALLRGHAAMALLRENSVVEQRDTYILSRTAIATHFSPCHGRRGTPATRGPGQPARPTRPPLRCPPGGPHPSQYLVTSEHGTYVGLVWSYFFVDWTPMI